MSEEEKPVIFQTLVDVIEHVTVDEEGVVTIKNKDLAEAIKSHRALRKVGEAHVCLQIRPPYVGMKCMDCKPYYPYP